MKQALVVLLLAMVLAPLAGCVVVERRDGYYIRPLLPHYRYPYRHYRSGYGHYGPGLDDSPVRTTTAMSERRSI